jgi:hypothetical protein
MRFSERRKRKLVVVENNLLFLTRRYNVTQKTLHDWRRFLGLSTVRNKHFFDVEEVKELDRFYVAAHIPREKRGKFWGLMMGKEMYGTYILDKGITLDEYLANKFGTTYEDFLYQRREKYGIEIFGN